MIRSLAIALMALPLLASLFLSGCASEPTRPAPISQPIVSGVTPTRASNTDTAGVVITGSGFESGAAAFIGIRALTNSVLVSSGEIRGIVPSGIAPGVYGMRVRNRDGGTGTLPQAFLVSGPGMVHSGEIAEDEVWALRDSPHVVSGEIHLRGPMRPTLVIEPGCRILFQNGARIAVGEGAPGRLVASGDGTPIEFTTSLTPGFERRGAWGHIALSGDSCAVLRDCRFRWGGGPTLGDLPASLVLLREGSAVIEDCLFEESESEGLHLEDGARPLSFARDTFRRCTGPLLSLRIDQTGALDAQHSIGEGIILVREGTLAGSLVWPGFEASYRIGFDLVARGTLTLGPGATLEFAAGTGIDVGVDSPGGLVAIGTEGSPVVLRSDLVRPSPGSWRGLRAGPLLAAESRLEFTEILHAGGNGHPAAVVCDGVSPVIRDSRIEGSGGLGIVFQSGARPSAFARNRITGCASYAIELPARGVGGLLGSNSFTGNGLPGLLVDGGVVSESALWNAFGFSTPYVIHGDLEVRGGGSPVLTIAPGATLRFDAGASLIVGDAGGSSSGALVAEAGAVPTLFTSVARPGIPQQPGDWDGIVFLDTSDDASCRLSGSVVEYGGAGQLGNVRCRDASPSLREALLQWSAGYGLYLEGSAAPDTSALSYQLNALGNVGP